MAILPLRQIQDPAGSGIAREWIDSIRDAISSGKDRNEICRAALCDLYFPEFSGDWESAVQDAKLPMASRLNLAALDPRNITLEPEFYGECDDARFQAVKPLLWLWYSFDRSFVGGQNVSLGVALRRMLAQFIFKRCGENFKAFHNVEFSFGYNLEVGDNVVVHRNVLLDDRGGIRLGNNVSISDYVNIYSHTHSIVDQKDVTNATTVLGDGVRITYHATVLAGVHVGEQGMVGAVAVATKDVRPYHVNVGIPAKSVRTKPNAPLEETITSVRRRTD